jgi:hypothetical protein
MQEGALALAATGDVVYVLCYITVVDVFFVFVFLETFCVFFGAVAAMRT